MSLLPVEEALGRLLALAEATPIDAREIVSLAAADGRALATDLVAGLDLPPWPNSAMDGYALASGRLAGGAAAGELRAGCLAAAMRTGKLAHARSKLIAAGRVTVDGVTVTKPSLTLPPDTVLIVATDENDRYVSRGGLNSPGVGETGLTPAGCNCLDVGQSTGAFRIACYSPAQRRSSGSM